MKNICIQLMIMFLCVSIMATGCNAYRRHLIASSVWNAFPDPTPGDLAHSVFILATSFKNGDWDSVWQQGTSELHDVVSKDSFYRTLNHFGRADYFVVTMGNSVPNSWASVGIKVGSINGMSWEGFVEFIYAENEWRLRGFPLEAGIKNAHEDLLPSEL